MDLSYSIWLALRFAFYDGYGVLAEIASFPVLNYNNLYSDSGDEVSPSSISIGNPVTGDPEFVDPDNGDFHLQSGSPCSSAGSDGTDIGAYGGSLDW